MPESETTPGNPTARPRSPVYAILFLMAALLALPAWLGRDFLRVSPGKAGLDLSYPYSARIAPDGSAVLTDSGERRILGLSPRGELRFILKGGRRTGGFYSGRPLGFDSAGAFYVDDTVYDLETDNVEARRIQKFSSSGRFLGTVLEYRFEGEAMSDWESHPVFGQMRGDVLHWFKKGEDGTWSLITLDASRGDGAVPTALPGIDVYDAAGAAVLSDSEIWFLRPDGRIEGWRPEGDRAQADGAVAAGDGDPGEAGFRLRFPTTLLPGWDGSVLAVDFKSRVYRFRPGSAAGGVETIFDGAYAGEDGTRIPVMFQTAAAAPDGGLALCDELSGSLVRIGPEGSAWVLRTARFGPKFRMLHLGSWAALVLGAACALGAVIALYARILGRRTPLLLKQLSIMMPVIALMVASVAVFVYQTLSDSLNGQLRDRLVHLAHQGAARTDPEAAAALDFRNTSYMELLESPEARSLIEVLDELVNLNEDPWDSSIFPYVYLRDGPTWWILGSFDYVEPYPYAKPEHQEVLDTGEFRYFRYDDIYGAWLSALAPIRDPQGRTVGVFEASMRGDSLDEAGRRFAARAAIGGGAILVVFLAMLAGFTYMLLRSVRKLQHGVSRISSGDYDIRVDIDSKDEIEDLGEAFNGMSAEIKGYVDRLADFSRANARFVPKEFIESLGRDSITSVRLGDQILTEMTVLFSDIRDFTALSESLGPRETIELLNEYLSRMGPVIRGSGGFIDKYIGDAIMALFPAPVDKAVRSMLGMMDSLEQYNATLRAAGRPELHSGVAIHTGHLMLGIIGEAERYEGTAIADTVNLASRLESLAKYYGVRALMSGDSVDSLEEKGYPLRFLDAVQVKGKTRSVRIFELVGRGDPLREGKLAGRKLYKEAFELYARGDFEGAGKAFQAHLERAEEDPPAVLLLERCRRYARESAPAGWKGVTVFSEK